MDPGQRNRRISIEASTFTRNAMNEKVETWAMFTEAFAEVLFGTGQERRQAAQEGASQTATFIVLATPKTRQVGTKHRINALGGVWDITSAIPVGMAEIHITATRSV